MRAIAMTARGEASVLQELELLTPETQAGEVQVNIKAVALNHLDTWVRRGIASPKLPLPHILGSDIAGVVSELGAGVTGLTVGQKVLINPGVSCGHCERCLSGEDNLCAQYQILGEHRTGGYAEYITVPRQNILPYPEHLSWEEAASIPLASLTAWQMVFDKAKVQPYHTVLVMSAGSGVSMWAIQMCKLAGARVIATAGSDDKLALAKDLGADEVINYRNEDYSKAIKALTGGQGVDVAIDHTGADNWQSSLKALRWGGTLVTCGATSGYEAVTPLAWVFFKQLNILGSTMGSKGDLFKILRLVEQKRLKPHVAQVFELSEAAKAHELMASRDFFGKIVLRVG